MQREKTKAGFKLGGQERRCVKRWIPATEMAGAPAFPPSHADALTRVDRWGCLLLRS